MAAYSDAFTGALILCGSFAELLTPPYEGDPPLECAIRAALTIVVWCATIALIVGRRICLDRRPRCLVCFPTNRADLKLLGLAGAMIAAAAILYLGLTIHWNQTADPVCQSPQTAVMLYVALPVVALRGIEAIMLARDAIILYQIRRRQPRRTERTQPNPIPLLKHNDTPLSDQTVPNPSPLAPDSH